MFSYKREMKQLFADSAAQFGALGLDEDNREERKQANAADQIEAQMEGASKKQKRRMNRQKFANKKKQDNNGNNKDQKQQQQEKGGKDDQKKPIIDKLTQRFASCVSPLL